MKMNFINQIKKIERIEKITNLKIVTKMNTNKVILMKKYLKYNI